MHNTGFFPDCHLLSLTDGSIWIPYLARYSEIFGDIQETQFSGSEMEVHVHLKIAFQAELETEESRSATIFGLPSTPRQHTETCTRVFRAMYHELQCLDLMIFRGIYHNISWDISQYHKIKTLQRTTAH